ncbi:hypothetical protein MYX78_08310 [Acidobacteria bacterium AH-259-G07]|nr:hypothetical protein [Acidobacteria bacterium AH-259-G07]
MIISNRTPLQWVGEFRLHQGNLEPWSTPWKLDGLSRSGNTFTVTIPGWGTTKVKISGDSKAKAGFLEMFGQGVSGSFDVAVHFFYEFRSAEQLVDSTGVPDGNADTTFVFPVEKSSTVNTGFAWSPWTITAPFLIYLTLFDSEGNVFDNKEITYNGHLSRFFDEIFSGLPTAFIGHVRIESIAPIYVTVLRFEVTSDGFQLTSATPE